MLAQTLFTLLGDNSDYCPDVADMPYHFLKTTIPIDIGYLRTITRRVLS